VTRRGKPPDDPGAHRQAGGPQVPAPRPEIEDLRELHDPYYDLLIPDPYCDVDPPRLPPDAIVIDRIRGWQPGAPPSLAELLESIRAREPEPDREAEP
jgi:hypothetical protein